MSKLLRIENTNRFLVVSEEEFLKKMRIEAIVRIEEKPYDDGIIRYCPQTPQWHEELEKLKEAKREELYPGINTQKKIYVDVKTLLIHYFYHSTKFYIRVSKLLELMDFVYKNSNGIVVIENYDACFGLSVEELERVVLNNANILDTTDKNFARSSTIYCTNPFRKTAKLAEELPLDEKLKCIIKVFVDQEDPI